MSLPRSLVGVARLVRRKVMLRGEAGIALPVSIAMLAITLALGLVAVQAAVSAIDGSNRDSRVKRALQAADAGFETAIWRMNTFGETINDPLSLTSCLVKVGEDLQLVAVQVGSTWCPTGAVEELGNGESYQYTVSGPAHVDFDGLAGTLDREIVSTGTVGAVTRRVKRRVSALDVRRLVSDYAVFSKEDLTLANTGEIGTPEVVGNARSNSDILLNHPQAHVHGNATPGPGAFVYDDKGVQLTGPNGQVDGSVDPAVEPLELPPVVMPAPADVDGQVCAPPLLLVTCPSTSSWNPTTRRLSLTGNTVVLKGNTFSFCSISMTNNSTLRFQPADLLKPVRVYIDSPDNCLVSGSPPGASMSLRNRPTIEWALDLLGLLSVNDLTFPIVEFYVVGDEPPTTISYENNNTNHTSPMMIYAPGSNVTLEQHADIEGGVLANRVTMENNSAVAPRTGGLGEFISGVTPVYRAGRYQECRSRPPAAGEPVDAGC